MRLLASEATIEHPGRLGVPIPRSVRAVIQRRLAPLSADTVQVLSAAAVVGREFDLSLVAPACELPVEHVLGSLSEAVALGVVTEEPGAVGRCRFSHSLMREVVYERLRIPLRIQLHRRVGEAIERLYGTGSRAHVAELARHFAEVAAAGEAAKALDYARQAGERAMGVYAYEEAAAQYQRALHALKFAGQTILFAASCSCGWAKPRRGRVITSTQKRRTCRPPSSAEGSGRPSGWRAPRWAMASRRSRGVWSTGSLSACCGKRSTA